MSSPSQLEKAKGGDAAAIADLINQALRSKGITVRGDRQGDCLRLWLTGSALPPQAPSVAYVRQGIERLQVANVAVLHIYGEQADQPKPGWGVEVVLGVPNAAVTPLDLEDLENPDAEDEIDRDIEAFLAPESAASGTTDHAYMLLELEPESSLQAVEGSYFKLKAQALREGDRPRVETLKQAFYLLKDHIENPPPVKVEPSPQAAAAAAMAALTPVERVQSLLKRQRLSAQVAIQNEQLQISWLAVRVVNPEEAAEQIHALLLSQDLVALGLGEVKTLVISALSRDRAVVWQQVLSLQA